MQNSTNCSIWTEYFNDRFYESMDLISVQNSSIILFSFFSNTFIQIFKDKALYGPRKDQIFVPLYTGSWTELPPSSPGIEKSFQFDLIFQLNLNLNLISFLIYIK